MSYTAAFKLHVAYIAFSSPAYRIISDPADPKYAVFHHPFPTRFRGTTTAPLPPPPPQHHQLHDKFFSIRSCFLLAVSSVSPAGGPHYSHTRCMSFSERERGTYVSFFLYYIPNTDVRRHGYAFPFGHTSYTVTLTLGRHIPLSLFSSSSVTFFDCASAGYLVPGFAHSVTFRE